MANTYGSGFGSGYNQDMRGGQPNPVDPSVQRDNIAAALTRVRFPPPATPAPPGIASGIPSPQGYMPAQPGPPAALGVQTAPLGPMGPIGGPQSVALPGVTPPGQLPQGMAPQAVAGGVPPGPPQRPYG